MANDKAGQKSRTVFVTANKYQQDIVLIVFLPSALIFLTFIFIVVLGNPNFSQAIFHTTFIGQMNQYSITIIVLMCILYSISVVRAFVLSHNMIGAYGRITRELDEIIAGKSQKTISSRPHDTLTKELLKRINILVEQYVQHRK